MYYVLQKNVINNKNNFKPISYFIGLGGGGVAGKCDVACHKIRKPDSDFIPERYCSWTIIKEMF